MNLGKIFPPQDNKPGTNYVGSSSLGEEVFQAKAHFYVTKQGAKDCMYKTAFPSLEKGNTILIHAATEMNIERSVT